MTGGNIIMADEWIPVILEFLHEGKVFKLTPSGQSMSPLLIGGRDSVKLTLPGFPLKKGDICLYRRDNGVHVLHRIYKVDRHSREYYMIGDHQKKVEGPLKEEQILAVAVSIIRKDREISCNNIFYKMLTHMWLGLRVFRPFILRNYDRFKSISGKGCKKDEDK